MMNHKTDPIQSRSFRFGWWVMMIVSILGVFNHLLLIFSRGEQVMFIGWAALNLFSIVLLMIPFRRGERWAWITAWIQVVAFAAPILFNADIAPFYLGAAAVLLVGMLLTASAFSGR
jgi:hypothetical protein